MAVDNPRVGDNIQAGLAPFVPPVHPCRVCGAETKAVGAGMGDDGRRICSKRTCRAEHGSMVVLLDGAATVVPWRSAGRTVHDVRALLHVAPDALLMMVVTDPEGSPPLSARAAARVAAMRKNPNQQDEGPPLHPCFECGQETKEGTAPGERVCTIRTCGKQFGVKRVVLAEGDDGIVMQPGMRFETLLP